MNPLGYQYSPLGYRTRLVDNLKTAIEPDDLLARGLRDVINGEHYYVTTWDFKRKVINRALDRFRYFNDWLADQENNDRLTPSLRKFVEDTIAFINTGNRPLNIHARLNAIQLELESKPAPPFKTPRSRIKLQNQLTVPAKDYMWHWLKHPNGFFDMLYAVNVFFGDINQIVATIK